MKDVYVLDACALIAFLNNEKGSNIIEELLINAKKGKCKLYIHIINLYEIYYDYMKRVSEMRDKNKLMKEFWFKLNQLPMDVYQETNYNLLNEAGKFKVKFRVSMADSIALGLAKIINGKVVTSDHHEFDVIEIEELLEFYWIR